MSSNQTTGGGNLLFSVLRQKRGEVGQRESDQQVVTDLGVSVQVDLNGYTYHKQGDYPVQTVEDRPISVDQLPFAGKYTHQKCHGKHVADKRADEDQVCVHGLVAQENASGDHR